MLLPRTAWDLQARERLVPPGWVPPLDPRVFEQRHAGIRVIVVPNESILVQDAYTRALGELTQSLLDAGADYGASVEVDTRPTSA